MQFARNDVLGIELMAVPFRAGVYGEVLGAGMKLVVASVVCALQTLDHLHTHACGQVGVFAVSLDAASPARVAEDVDGRGPEGQPLVALILSLGSIAGVLGPCLVGHGGEYLLQQVGVKAGSHADGLREYGSQSGPCHSVQCFVPPVVGLDVQPLYRLGAVHHQ